MRSPLLDLPGAVAADGLDADVAAHYGSLYGEQRTLEDGSGFVDLSHRDVIRLTGPDRLSWLHNLTSQHFAALAPKTWTGALILSPQGHVEHAFYGVDDGEAFTAHTEPGQAAGLIAFLERMKFMTRVEIFDVTADLAVAWRPRSSSSREASAPRSSTARATCSAPASSICRSSRGSRARSTARPSRRRARPPRLAASPPWW